MTHCPTPAEAFARDMARLTPRTTSVPAPSSAILHWLQVAQAAHRCAALPRARRAQFVRSLGDHLFDGLDGLPTQNEDVGRTPTSTLEIFVTRVRRVIEEMERGQALDLAESTIISACGIAADEGPEALALAMAQRGRILRQRPSMQEAEDAYRALIELQPDAPIAGLGWLGLSLIYRHRGNRPAEMDAGQRGLALAEPGSLLEASVRQALMNVYLSLAKPNEAFEQGWRVLRLVTGRRERETGALTNMGFLALQTGFPGPALHVLQCALAKSPPIARHKLPVFQGMVRAAAALNDTRLLRDLDHKGRQELAVAAEATHYEATRFLQALAEAWWTSGDIAKATSAAEDALLRARMFGINETTVRLETLLETLRIGNHASFIQPTSDVPTTDWRDDRHIQEHAERLYALSA